MHVSSSWSGACGEKARERGVTRDMVPKNVKSGKYVKTEDWRCPEHVEPGVAYEWL